MGYNRQQQKSTFHIVPKLLFSHCGISVDPALFTAARTIFPDELHHSLDHETDAPDAPPSPPSTEGHGRQKSSAALRSFEPSAFLARISAPMSQATADVISNVRGHYNVPDRDQLARVEDTRWYRAGLKPASECWPFPYKKYHGFNREDSFFTRPPGIERFVPSPDNVWYGRLKHLFTLSVHIDEQAEPVELECAYVSFCYEIKLRYPVMYSNRSRGP